MTLCLCCGASLGSCHEKWCGKCKDERLEQEREIIHYARQIIRRDKQIRTIFHDIAKENRPTLDDRMWALLWGKP